MKHTTEQERSGMLPCPFCLGHSTLDSNGEKFRVFCWDCKAKSNEFDTWEEAESAWMRRAPAVPTRKQIEQYLYEQGAVTVSRDVAEAAGLARLAGKMQSAPAAPVPQFSRIAQKKLDYLLEAGEAITGYAIENKDGRRGAIDCHGFVYWWHDAAAPQPPEAAPVQLPEPVAVMTDTTPREPGWKTMFVPDSGTRLYTEHQVRQLLAAQEQST